MTETLLAWGVVPVACTRFCERPELAHVGGTKDPDIAAVVALDPDLVVMCDEENRREDVEALEVAGVAVHSCSPRSVSDVGPVLARLAEAVDVGSPVSSNRPKVEPSGARVFVPIWRRPWMSMAADTYGSSMLEALGLINVFADVPDRYPEVTLHEAAARRPDLVLAPSEPYPFRSRHEEELSVVAPVAFVDGQDLFWWGVRTPAALERLSRVVSARA